jgi:cell division protein FtsZ
MGLVKPLPAQVAKIKVVGIGGAGGNAVNFMTGNSHIRGVDFISINTDTQALLVSQAKIKVQIGDKLTRGLGSGGNPKVGHQAAEESKEKIKQVMEGSDMVFITAGLGGGTGTGAAPVIAKIAKEELGILTVAVVTKPFFFEGTKRMVVAEDAIEKLKQDVDTLIVVPNQKLMDGIDKKIAMIDAFKMADSVLSDAVAGIADLIVTPGLINLDFADIRSIMKDAGTALMGVGIGSGENKAKTAIMQASSSPLLDTTIEGARGVLFNITSGPEITMNEVEETSKIIAQSVGGDANIIFGVTIDDKLKDQVKITLIATGFDDNHQALSGLIKPKKPIFSATIGKDKYKKPASPPPSEANFDTDEESLELEKRKEELIGNEKLPQGIELDNELDIPSFLRKDN